MFLACVIKQSKVLSLIAEDYIQHASATVCSPRKGWQADSDLTKKGQEEGDASIPCSSGYNVFYNKIMQSLQLQGAAAFCSTRPASALKAKRRFPKSRCIEVPFKCSFCLEELHAARHY